MTRIAILDDYLNEALDCADWSVLTDCEIRVFDGPFDGEDAAAASLAGFEVAVAMRERTPFPASLLEKLPDLRLLVTTGMRNLSLDMEAARGLGITIAGTGALALPRLRARLGADSRPGEEYLRRGRGHAQGGLADRPHPRDSRARRWPSWAWVGSGSGWPRWGWPST